MKQLGMLKGEPGVYEAPGRGRRTRRPAAPPRRADALEVDPSRLGEEVPQGVLGRVVGPYTFEIETVTAPFDPSLLVLGASP